MRIVGGRDYYDGAAAYGVDTTIVFVRDSLVLTNAQMDTLGGRVDLSVSLSEPIREDVDRWDQRAHSPRISADDRYQKTNALHGIRYVLKSHMVFFCGKEYRGLEVIEGESLQQKVYFFWSWEKLVKWANERNLVVKKTLYGWQKEDDDYDPFASRDLRENEIQSMIACRAAILMKKEEAQPGGSYRRGRAALDSGWRANCDGLRDIGFQAAVDPVTAFQELSMWVGGTLSSTNGPPIIEIQDDKIKLAKHGMDKWSFRKHKDDAK